MTTEPIDIKSKSYRNPIRIFEGAGFVNPDESYYVPLQKVTNRNKQDLQTMIDRGRYFSIFAPRQSGKTTFLTGTCNQLHDDPTYVAILLSFQRYNNLKKTKFYALIEKSLYSQLSNRLREVGCLKFEEIQQFLARHHLSDHISFSQLFEELNHILQFKKIVIFIDEFDGIPLKELGNFLTALRELYQEYKGKKQKALYSVGLIGIRNITKLVVGGVSPFNIADQVTLPPFTLENVRDLYAQYTAETNQPFTTAAVQKVYEETAGQPWLVNRLGTILTMDIKPETVDPIDEHDVEKAVQVLLMEKNDHFDNLYEKAKLYKETFVEIIFDHVKYNPDDEDQAWLEQYGLIKNSSGYAVVANNIYKARYLRTFFKEIQASDDISPQEYELPGNKLENSSVRRQTSNQFHHRHWETHQKKEKEMISAGPIANCQWSITNGQNGSNGSNGSNGVMEFKVDIPMEISVKYTHEHVYRLQSKDNYKKFRL